MSDDRFDRLDEKLDRIEDFLANYRVKSESRLTKIELVQKGFLTLLGTSLASISSVVVYLLTGGSK